MPDPTPVNGPLDGSQVDPVAAPALDAHLTPDELRVLGAQLTSWVADFLAHAEQRTVGPQVEPGWVRAQLPPAAPEQPEPWSDIIADLDRIVVPALAGWQSPSWFAYFPANTSGPSILGDLVSSGLGEQGMLWATSPAATEMETTVVDWLIDALGLPDRFRSTGAGGGSIQSSASDAVLVATVAARERARDRADGDLRRLVAYTSTQAHSSVEKAIRIAGLTADQLRLVAVDETFAADPGDLARQLEADRAAGLVPFLCVATVGTTASLAIDPVDALGRRCQAEGMWLHVDAAMAGSANLLPELRDRLGHGLERADSWCFDPHKWLFTNFDCDVLYVADRAAVIDALSILPEYLRNDATASGAVIDYRDWQVPLGRRFRALKLWFVLRHYGLEGLRGLLRHHLALTADLAARLRADHRFEVVAPVELNLVCFAHRDGDEATEDLLRALNQTGEVYVTHARLAGRNVLRVCIGQSAVDRRHVERLWALVDQLAPPTA